MKNIYSASGDLLFALHQQDHEMALEPRQSPVYTILYIPDGTGVFYADSGKFDFSGPVILFSTPLQYIHISSRDVLSYIQLQFHGDYYCIEYHRKEVSCNGLLFNNIYIDPLVKLSAEESSSFAHAFDELSGEIGKNDPSDIVLRAYLQLILAKSSSIKLRHSDESTNKSFAKDQEMERFRHLLDENYLSLHRPSDYAKMLAMSPNNFTRRCRSYFKKSPSNLIQERLILEAKKQLHLTRQSIKEIAYKLNFQDEFYFSRVFKKFVKVSPQTFREQTGISIVADLSKS